MTVLCLCFASITSASEEIVYCIRGEETLIYFTFPASAWLTSRCSTKTWEMPVQEWPALEQPLGRRAWPPPPRPHATQIWPLTALTRSQRVGSRQRNNPLSDPSPHGPRPHLPNRISISLLPPGKSREAEAAAAWVTGIKGTLKLNSVAEEEKSKLVPDEEAEAAPPPPPLGFLSAMAAVRRPLHVYGWPVRNHRPETERSRGQHTSALAHKDRNSGRPLSYPLPSPTGPPESNMGAPASRPGPST